MAKILIIDDDDQFRRMLCQMMERAGYEVLDAPSGNDGIRLFQENTVDLVVTDIIMPDTEGIETIEKLKEEFPDIRIIAVSGGGRVSPKTYLDAAKIIGAGRSFAKPIDQEEFLKAIRELLALDGKAGQ